jgi:electron transport complex protein RnfG
MLLVATVSLGAALLITGAYEVSHERIVENERTLLLANLGSVVEVAGGNEPDAQELNAPDLQGNEYVAQVFAMLDDSQLLAWVYAGVAPQGYNGPIDFLLGLTPRGDIIRVRIIRHRETPGLGDAIESEKSDWIRQFEGRSLEYPTRWALAADGGEFDALTGATVTPRAVVAAIEAVLQYHAASGDALETALERTLETRQSEDP